MRRHRKLFLVLFLGLLFTPQIVAQNSNNPAAEAAELRGQLIEVQNNESHARLRLDQLNEDLKPENIERAMSGYGSTRPEELREQRRRELTIERDAVKRQLELLETSRMRLESAIQLADSRAYQQSAEGYSANYIHSMLLSSIKKPGRVVLASVTLLGLVAIVGLVAFMRRRPSN